MSLEHSSEKIHNLSVEEINEILTIMQRADMQKILMNKDLLSVILDTNEPQQETIEQIMQNDDVRHIFHNSTLMTDIVRLQNKINNCQENQNYEKNVPTENEIKNIEENEKDFIEPFIKMGYEKMKIIALVHQYGKNIPLILNALNC